MQDTINEIVGKEAFEQCERLIDLLVKMHAKLEDFIRTGKQTADDNGSAKGFQQTAEAAKKAAAFIEESTRAQADHKAAAAAVNTILKDYSGTVEANIKRSIEYKLQIQQLKTEKKELDKQFASRESDGYRSKLAEITKAEEQAKVASAELSQTLKSQIKELNAVEGSYDQLNQRLGQMRNLFRQLSESDREGEVGQALLGEITQLDQKLKAIDASIGNFQRNVGNYASGFSNFSDAFKILQSELDATRNKINQLSNAEETNGEILKQLQKEEALLSRLVDDQIAGFASATQELKKNEQALQSLAAAGLQNTEFYDQLLNNTAELKDRVADLKAEIKNLGSDTSTLEGLIEGMNALAGGYAIAQGAAQLLGGENEDLQKSMVKLQAIMSIMMGLQQIQNALQAESSLMLLISSARTKALAAAQAVYTFATTGATAATNAFRAALIGTGIGALVVLLGIAANAMMEYANSTDTATDSLEKQREELEKLYRLQKEVADEAETERNARRGRLNELKRELDLEEAKGTSQQKILDLKRAVNVEEQRNLRIRILSTDDDKEKLRLTEELKDKQTELKVAVIETNNKIAEDNKKAAEKRRKEAEEEAKKLKALQERNLKATYELIKKDSEGKADEFKSVIDDEAKSLDDRLQALSHFYVEKEKIIKAGADYEALSGDKTAKEILVIEAQKENDLANLRRTSARESIALVKQQTDEEGRYRIQYLEALTLYNQQLEQDELDNLIVQLSKRRIGIEKYEREVEAIKSKYAKKSLDETIEFLENEIKTGKIFGDEAIELQKRIDAARLQSHQLTNQRIFDSQKRLRDSYKQLAQEVVSSFITITNGTYEKKIQQADRNIEKIEKEKNAELNRIDQVSKNEDEARKLKASAEAKYNAEKEKEEANKRTLQKRQAAFNKAADIANIATRTALAVVTTLSDNTIQPGYLRLPLAIAAGAIGAVQLATAIATPLPQFYKGTDASPEGWAWVGERGTEGRINPDGSSELTPGVPTLTYLKRGTKIIPHDEIVNMAHSISTSLGTVKGQADSNQLNFDKAADRIINAIQSQRKDPQTINIHLKSNTFNKYEYKYYRK